MSSHKMGPPRIPVSLHVLPAGALLLRDDTTLHFLSRTNLSPQRQPAAFDALSYVYPRPRDSCAFACVQTSPQLAVSVWRYIADGEPEDLICVCERTVVCADSKSDLRSVPCCWDMEGSEIVFGLPTSQLAIVDLSDPSSPPSIHVFATPDLSEVKAVVSSPHDADVFAVACASGRTFLCRLSPENNKDSDNLLVPDVLHTLPDLAGRPAATLAFHPTSTDPESLMLAILHSRIPNPTDLGQDDTSEDEEEVQVWCVNVRKSVNLIRRLRHGVSVRGARGGDRFLKWSKNGRVVQFVGNSLIIYDVRRNNGAQETIRTPEGTQIVAVDLHRDAGMAWVLDSAMQLHIYDLLHCTEILNANVQLDTFARSSSARIQHTPKSFTLSPPRVRLSGTAGQDKDVNILRRKSSDLLAYYLNQSPDRDASVGAVGGTREALAANSTEAMNEDVTEGDDNEQPAFPATAIRVTSPIWTLTEPDVTMIATQGQQQQSLLPDIFTTEGVDFQEQADQGLAMPQPILPDCLFSYLGELMQGSDTGLDFSPSAPSTSRTILETLFGWPPAYAGTSARDLVAWERQRVLTGTPATSSAFVRVILDIWLRDAGGNNPVRGLELALTSLQANTSTRNMTVSISWLVYAMHLVALQHDTLSPGASNEKQKMARIFTDTVLFRDKDSFGDDVEAVHLATGILIGCGLIKEAREIYRTNAYYLEATILSLLFGLPVEEILRDWIVQATETGAARISLRCHNAISFLAASTSQKSAPLLPAPQLYPPTPTTQVTHMQIHSSPPTSTAPRTAGSSSGLQSASPVSFATASSTTAASPAPSISSVSARWRRPDLSIQLFKDDLPAQSPLRKIRNQAHAATTECDTKVAEEESQRPAVFPTRSDSLNVSRSRIQQRIQREMPENQEQHQVLGTSITRERTIINTSTIPQASTIDDASQEVSSLTSTVAATANESATRPAPTLERRPTFLSKSGTPRGGVMKFLMASSSNDNTSADEQQESGTTRTTRPDGEIGGVRRNKSLLRSLTSGATFAYASLQTEESSSGHSSSSSKEEISSGSGGSIWKRLGSGTDVSSGKTRLQLFRSASERGRGAAELKPTAERSHTGPAPAQAKVRGRNSEKHARRRSTVAFNRSD